MSVFQRFIKSFEGTAFCEAFIISRSTLPKYYIRQVIYKKIVAFTITVDFIHRESISIEKRNPPSFERYANVKNCTRMG